MTVTFGDGVGSYLKMQPRMQQWEHHKNDNDKGHNKTNYNNENLDDDEGGGGVEGVYIGHKLLVA